MITLLGVRKLSLDVLLRKLEQQTHTPWIQSNGDFIWKTQIREAVTIYLEADRDLEISVRATYLSGTDCNDLRRVIGMWDVFCVNMWNCFEKYAIDYWERMKNENPSRK